jgi:hypothetical protein
MKDFFELKLQSMTMDEYEIRFLELLKYVGFIKDEQVNIQRFLSGFPSMFSNKIQYDDPNMEDKKRGHMEQRNKGNKPLFFKNNSQGKPTHYESQM